MMMSVATKPTMMTQRISRSRYQQLRRYRFAAHRSKMNRHAAKAAHDENNMLVPYDGGAAANTAIAQSPQMHYDAIIRIECHMPAELQFGEDIVLVGAVPALGSWQLKMGVPMTYEDGIWSANVALPCGSHVEFKPVVVTTAGREARWLSCANGDNFVISCRLGGRDGGAHSSLAHSEGNGVSVRVVDVACVPSSTNNAGGGGGSVGSSSSNNNTAMNPYAAPPPPPPGGGGGMPHPPMPAVAPLDPNKMFENGLPPNTSVEYTTVRITTSSESNDNNSGGNSSGDSFTSDDNEPFVDVDANDATNNFVAIDGSDVVDIDPAACLPPPIGPPPIYMKYELRATFEHAEEVLLVGSWDNWTSRLPMTKLDLLPAGRNDNDVVDIDEDDAEEEGITTTTTTTTATTGSLGGDVFFASFGMKAPSEPGELGMDSFELKFIVDGVWKTTDSLPVVTQDHDTNNVMNTREHAKECLYIF